MTYQKTLDGILIEARIKTNCNSFSIKKDKEKFLIEVSSSPVEGKANKEIIKGMRKLFKTDIEIVRGLKSKDKIILIKGSLDEIERIIKQF
ncbi:MAG: YggU family protein [Candidatus Aenigmarchaeota archaeon]|nr:YggU family protein [Candidatus Aenigmarchaeota archaeon]